MPSGSDWWRNEEVNEMNGSILCITSYMQQLSFLNTGFITYIIIADAVNIVKLDIHSNEIVFLLSFRFCGVNLQMCVLVIVLI